MLGNISWILMPNYHGVPSELYWRNMSLSSFNIKSEYQPTLLGVGGRGDGFYCVTLSLLFCSLFYMCRSSSWLLSPWLPGRTFWCLYGEVLFSSARHVEAVGLRDPDWSPPYPWEIACIVHGAIGTEAWPGHQESCPQASHSFLWASVSSSIKMTERG